MEKAKNVCLISGGVVEGERWKLTQCLVGNKIIIMHSCRVMRAINFGKMNSDANRQAKRLEVRFLWVGKNIVVFEDVEVVLFVCK